ncbi:hypothetical protein D3C76_1605970 [compost metagenome]
MAFRQVQNADLPQEKVHYPVNRIFSAVLLCAPDHDLVFGGVESTGDRPDFLGVDVRVRSVCDDVGALYPILARCEAV